MFSIGFSKRGSRLEDIIASGDMLNHAILTKEELESALNKLCRNDFIRYSKNRFCATDKARDFFKENRRLSEDSITEWLRIAEVLKKIPVQIIELGIIEITEEEYENAVKKYTR